MLFSLFAVATFCIATPQGNRIMRFSLEQIESLALGEDGDGTSCTATSKCFNFWGAEEGSVSCTGTSCSRGHEWVECDGVTTKC